MWHNIEIRPDSVEMWSEKRARAGRIGWHQHKPLTEDSWRRVMYVAYKYKALLFPHEICFTGQESSPAHVHTLAISFNLQEVA